MGVSPFLWSCLVLFKTLRIHTFSGFQAKVVIKLCGSPENPNDLIKVRCQTAIYFSGLEPIIVHFFTKIYVIDEPFWLIASMKYLFLFY